MNIVLADIGFQKNFVRVDRSSRACSRVELVKSSDWGLPAVAGGFMSGSHSTLIPATRATVSNKTRGDWLLILRVIGSLLSGLSSGKGRRLLSFASVARLASSTGVSAR